MWQKTLYLVQEAFRTVKRHKGVTSISVVIMSLSLLMLAVFLLATDNVLKFIGQSQQDTRVYVYLDDRLNEQGIQALQRQILSRQEVESVVFISKEEALEDFREQLDEDAELLDALEANPLPNSFWVTFLKSRPFRPVPRPSTQAIT